MKKFILHSVLAVALTAVSLAGALPVSAQSPGMQPSDPNSNLRVADISYYNTPTNWSAAASNLDAIYIRATAGVTITDKKFVSNTASAQKANIKYGFYHFFYPYADLSKDVQQADRFYDAIKNYDYDCIPVLDLEATNEADNMPALSKAQIINAANAFIKEFKKVSGQDIMIYSYCSFIDEYLDSSFSAYKLWIASQDGEAPKDTKYLHTWTMWQYAGEPTGGMPEGRLAGFDGYVDLDRASSGIFLDNGPAPSPASYSLSVDKTYLPGTKSFSATAALEGGTMMMVTTLETGEQVYSYQPLSAEKQTYQISVNGNAVKTAVYLTKGSFTGDNVPVTYGLTQYVRAN